MIYRRHKLLHSAILAVLAGGVLASDLAHAQDKSPEHQARDQQEQKKAAPAAARFAPESVIVTAQKREESAQSVPLAIAVVAGEDIVDKGIYSSNDIQRLVPGLSGQQSGFSRPRWFIRGIGSNDPSLTTESPLGVYRDEVFTALTSLQSFAIYDLERVEVLRGPQGTLWGKNTTAGAINFISRKPSFESDGYVRLTAGEWGAKSAQGAAGGAITEDIAGRVSVFHQEYDGYAKNLYTGDDGPSYKEDALRLQLLGNVTENLTALVNVHFGTTEPNGGYSYTVNSEPGGADRYGFTPGYGAHPKAGDDFYAGESTSKTDEFGNLLKLDWQLGDYTLTSISAYDESDGKTRGNSGNPPTYTGERDITSSWGDNNSWQISQEVRLVSPQDQRATWVTGLHYFRYRFNTDSASATFAPNPRRTYSRTWLSQDAESYAAFGSLKFKFTDRFAVTTGLRWTHEEKDVDIHTIRSTGATFSNISSWWNASSLSTPLSYDQDLSESGSWTELTGDITPEYQLTDDVLLYFRYARGYRSGGFNSSIPVLNSAQIAAGVQPYIPAVEPEYLDDYEFGFKSTWLDNTLLANAAVFYYDHKDIQLNVQAPNPLNLQNPPTGSFSQNAAKGEVKGLELELQWHPVDNFKVGGSFNITDAEYKDFNPVLSVSGVTQTVNRSGNDYFRTPKYLANIDLEYRIPLTNAGTVVLSTDWVYRSHQYYDAARQGKEQGEVAVALDGNVYQSEWQEQGAYWIGNAKVAYLTSSEKIELFATVNNVLDKNYVVNSTVAAPSYPVSLGQPRFVNFGVTARW